MIFNNLGGGRRRLLMSIAPNKGPYPDPWVDDGKIWCYYNVTTTESATSLGNSVNRYAGLEIDGVSVTPTNSYTFSTTGEHLVKITVVNKYTNTFNGCKTLIRCYYPDGIALSNDDFQSCSNLTFFRFPSDVTSVGQRTFYGCHKLEIKKLSLSTLTSLNAACFNDCRKIKKITDLGSITSIPGNYVFQNCKGLTDVILPDTITSIGTGAFDGCTSLSSFTVLATTPPSFGSYVFRNISNIPDIYVPSESVEAYKAASGWSSYSSKIQAIPE